MRRVQVSFSDEELAYLAGRAAATGQSIAALVREAVDQDRARDEQRRRRDAMLSVLGKYRSGLTDLAENHDEYFVQAIEERIGRR